MLPVSSRTFRSSGIAVISLDFSSVLIAPKSNDYLLPGTYHVYCCFVGRLVIRVPGSLAVYRHNLWSNFTKCSLNPIYKTARFFRTNPCKHTTKGIMEGIPEGSQEPLLTILPLPSKRRYLVQSSPESTRSVIATMSMVYVLFSQHRGL